jgi:hypothetical protein
MRGERGIFKMKGQKILAVLGILSVLILSAGCATMGDVAHSKGEGTT